MTLRLPTALETTRRMINPPVRVVTTSSAGVTSSHTWYARRGYRAIASVKWPMISSTLTSTTHLPTTPDEVATGRQDSCAPRSRGGRVSTRNCSVMITASVEGECANEMCQYSVTRYRDANATSGGAMVCTTTITAINMLRLMSTGSVIA